MTALKPEARERGGGGGSPLFSSSLSLWRAAATVRLAEKAGCARLIP